MTVWPNGSRTKPQSTTGWGWYDPYDTGDYVFHYGDDEIGFDWNCAPEAGTVVYASFNGAAGNDIRVQSHRDGTIFRMLHNANLDSVWVGKEVTEGQKLAPQGNTSTERIGRHTHLEVWPEGNINNRLNPVPWMNARVGSSSAGGNSKPITEQDDDVTPRPLTTDGGKTFQIMFEDGYMKPLLDQRDGTPMSSAVVVELNLFLRYDKKYYPNGIRGAAKMAPDVAAQFANALKRP